MTPCLCAVQHISRLPGGSQPQLMRCSDEAFYVVKFRNNPQSKQVLANDYVGTKLAHSIGLPVPAVTAIHVSKELIRATPALRIELRKGSERFLPGRQFGSRLVTAPQSGAVVDWIPSSFFQSFDLRLLFAGAFVFDLWTCNADRRQAVFYRRAGEPSYQAVFIDQGGCFSWSLSQSGRLTEICRYADPAVYHGFNSVESFAPWLARIEAMGIKDIKKIVSSAPTSWTDHHFLDQAVATLEDRKAKLHGLVESALSQNSLKTYVHFARW